MTAPMNEMNIDEYESLASGEEQQQEEQKANALDVTLEGDDVPDELKGKAVKDVVQAYKALGEGFKKSEAERQRLASQPIAQVPAPAPAPQQPVPEPELTDDQLRELNERDPIAASRAIAQAEAKRTQQRLYDERIGPITHTLENLVATQELLARQRHADVFEKYGQEIKDALSGVNRNALSSPQAWDDIVSWVRGRHLSDYVEAEVQKRLRTTQQEQKEAAGATLRPSNRAPTPPAKGLDPLEQEVMAKMGIFKDEREYLKWKGQQGTFTMEG